MRIISYDNAIESLLKENFGDEILEEDAPGEYTLKGSVGITALGGLVGGPLGAYASILGYTLYKVVKQRLVINKIQKTLGNKEAVKVSKAYRRLEQIFIDKELFNTEKEEAAKLAKEISGLMKKANITKEDVK